MRTAEAKPLATSRFSHSSVGKREAAQEQWPAVAPSSFQGVFSGMQQSHGNQAVQRLLRAYLLQAKLTVNQPGDEYEQEADGAADQVMRMELQDALSRPQGLNQPDSDVQRKCAECEEEEKIQRKADGDGFSSAAGPMVEEVLRSPGQPLDGTTRAFFEPRFGYDFSNVRVHTDALAIESARSVNALAYTVGNNVVFSAHKYSPESLAGQRLLAHELSHVIQQGGAKALATGPSGQFGSASVRLSRSPDHEIARLADEGLEDPLYPLQAGCVAQQVCGVSGGVPDPVPISERCSQKTGYHGPTVRLSDDECDQYLAGSVLSEERLKVLSLLLVEYRARVLAEKLTTNEVTRIRDAIDYRAIPALERAAVGKERITMALSVDPDPKIVQALRDPSTAPAAALAFARLAPGAEGLSVAAEAGAGSRVVLTVIEGGAGAAATAEAAALPAEAAVGLTAAELVPPLLLIAAVVLLVLWIESLPEPRADRRAPELLENAIQEILRVLEDSRKRDIQATKKEEPKTKPSPAPGPKPFPLPPLKPEEKEKCPFPTGLTPRDPIPMVWYKVRMDDYYPRFLTLQGVEYDRDDPSNPRTLPLGEPIGVPDPYWPHKGKIIQLLDEKRGDNASRFRDVLTRYGFSWEGLDADHVQDLQWGGPDIFENLWPLSNSANKSAGELQNNAQRVSFCVTKIGPPRINIALRRMKEEGHFGRFFVIWNITRG